MFGDRAGIPDNASDRLRKLVDSQGVSNECRWLPAANLVNFPWEQTRVYFSANVKPKYVHMFEREASFPAGLDLPKIEIGNRSSSGLHVEWSESAVVHVGQWWLDQLLEEINRLGPFEKTRLIFWYC